MFIKPNGACESGSTRSMKKCDTLGNAAAKSHKHKIERSCSACAPGPEPLLLAAEEDVVTGPVDGGLPLANPLARTERTGPLAKSERTSC